MADYFKTTGEGLPREVLIPSGVLQANLLSETSVASDCFVYQYFSNKLQAYMIGYVNSIFSDHPISV